jgi:hypothetical protein
LPGGPVWSFLIMLTYSIQDKNRVFKIYSPISIRSFQSGSYTITALELFREPHFESSFSNTIPLTTQVSLAGERSVGRDRPRTQKRTAQIWSSPNYNKEIAVR